MFDQLYSCPDTEGACIPSIAEGPPLAKMRAPHIPNSQNAITTPPSMHPNPYVQPTLQPPPPFPPRQAIPPHTLDGSPIPSFIGLAPSASSLSSVCLRLNSATRLSLKYST